MIKMLSRSYRERLRKEKHEAELKHALATKVSSYEIKAKNDETQFTVIELDGRKMLVHKEHITIHDVTAYSA